MATTLDWVKSLRANILDYYDQLVQEVKIRLVIDDLIYRQKYGLRNHKRNIS